MSIRVNFDAELTLNEDADTTLLASQKETLLKDIFGPETDLDSEIPISGSITYNPDADVAISGGGVRAYDHPVTAAEVDLAGRTQTAHMDQLNATGDDARGLVMIDGQTFCTGEESWCRSRYDLDDAKVHRAANDAVTINDRTVRFRDGQETSNADIIGMSVGNTTRPGEFDNAFETPGAGTAGVETFGITLYSEDPDRSVNLDSLPDDPGTFTENTFPSAEAFIDIESEGFSDELALKGQITDLEAVRVDEAAGFQLFSEPADAQVSAVYLGYFGRAADPAGQTYWTDEVRGEIDAGRSPASVAEDMATGFRASTEAQAKYPFLAPENAQDAATAEIETFVSDVFGNLFNRTPATEGVDYWANEIERRLDTGEGIADVIVDILAGAKGDDAEALAHKVEAANAYTDAAAPGEFDADASVNLIGQVGAPESSLEAALADI